MKFFPLALLVGGHSTSDRWRYVIFILLLAGLSVPASADAYDVTPGVPVQLWGFAKGRASPGPTAQVQLTASDFLDADGSGVVPITLTGSTSSSSAIYFNTSTGTAQMEPGKTYVITVSAQFAGGSISDVGLQIAPPVGYEIEIDGLERSRKQVGNTSQNFLVRVLGSREQSFMTAGSSTQLMLGRIYWQVGLGGLRNGSGAGAISIVDPGSAEDWSPLFTPVALEYETPGAEITVIREIGTGVLRQVVANQSVVDIIAASTTAYDIAFYHPSQSTGSGTTVRTFTGQPYINYRVEQGATASTLKITRTTRDTNAANSWTAAVVHTEVTSLARQDTGDPGWPTYTWTRLDWNATGPDTSQLAEQVTTSGGTTADRTDTMVVRVPGSTTNALNAARTYHQYTWGEEIKTSTVGSSDSAQTTYDYYDAPTEKGRHGYMKSVVRPGGGWEGYDYWDATLTGGTTKTGTLKFRYRPFGNSPASVGFSSTAGEVTSYTYALDPFGTYSRTSLVETMVNGVLTAKTETNYVNATTTLNGAYLVEATRRDSISGAASLTTVTSFYRENTTDTFVRNQLHSVTRPDNVRVSYAYQRGNLNGTSFTPHSAGLASRIVAITGVAGSTYTAYNGYNLSGLSLIDGKSTLEMVIRDSRALVVRTESQVWVSGAWRTVGRVNFTYDTFGHVTARTSLNGATASSTYVGDRKTYDVDETGIRTDYEYDDAGRLWKAKKRNQDNSDFTTIVTYSYDAAGRSKSEKVSGTGTTETVETSRTYDDAGRLKTETPAGLGTTQHRYDVNALSHTVETPDGGIRTETALLDGRPGKLEGDATVATYYTYSVDATTGQRIAQINLGDPTSSRYSKSWADWLGRAVKSEVPGFSLSSPSQPALITQSFYDDATVGLGRLYKTTRNDGTASTLYSYDSLGSVTRSGVDINADGALVNNSTDRIAETDQYVESDSSSQYWLRSDSRVYFPSESTARTVSITRQRLTGYTGNRRSETSQWSVEDLTATTPAANTVVDVSAATKTVTTTTTAGGVSSSEVATVTNGLSVSLQTSDGLTYGSEYDKLERLKRQKNPRHTTGEGDIGYSVYVYKTGTTQVESVTDAAGNPVSLNHYDNMGRVDWTQIGGLHYLRTKYNIRGQVYRQWGDATSPVEYGYDTVYGQRTSLSTYRAAPAADSETWPDVGDPDTTQWAYDPATGLMRSKTDMLSNVVEFDYNASGQVASRKWARFLSAAGHTSERVKTSYEYYAATGELWKVIYNDEVETIPTPDLTYTYDRLGRVATVDEKATEGEGGFGTRTFAYDATNPWRLLSETLPAGFGSRVLTRLYEEATSSNAGTLSPHTKGTQKGRMAGFTLGISSDTDRDLNHGWVFSNQPRFAAVSAAIDGGTAVDFIYTYKGSSTLLDGYSRGTYTVARGYEDNRDLVTSLESKFGTDSVARFDYVSDVLGRRESVKQSGAAFAAYTAGQSYSAVYHRYTYNARSELESDRTYGGNDVTQATNELPGRRLEYRYDSIGNRKTAGATGASDSTLNETGSGDEDYEVNALNQYTKRENNQILVTGAVASTADVAVLGTTSTAQVDNAWANTVVPDNTTTAAIGEITAYAAVPGATSPIRKATSQWLTPKRKQEFEYDADGNLWKDGLWEYTYNAENQLVRMTSLLPSGFGAALSYVRKQIDFKYDYTGRRIEKRVNNMGASTEISARRFLYDGWNLVAELDGTGATIQRSYVWGLDLTGDPARSGGVGALLQLTNYTAGAPGANYYPAYDGNGNVVSLVNATTGELAAIYEYDPFGNLIRNEAIDSAVADNPFRFSTKYTDGETGLVYYGLRYYSPALGRFINKDPIEESGGLNLYGFCGNNGINSWDYLGMAEDGRGYEYYAAFDVPDNYREMVSWYRRTIRWDYPGLQYNPIYSEWVWSYSDPTGQYNPIVDGRANQHAQDLADAAEQARRDAEGSPDYKPFTGTPGTQGETSVDVQVTFATYNVDSGLDPKTTEMINDGHLAGITSSQGPSIGRQALTAGLDSGARYANAVMQNFKFWNWGQNFVDGVGAHLASAIYDRENYFGWDNNVASFKQMFGTSEGWGGVLGGGLTAAVVPQIPRSVTTADGFLLGSVSFKTPVSIPLQRFGGMSIRKADPWALAGLSENRFLNRMMNAILPKWNPLKVYTEGTVPAGTPITIGIVGPQGTMYPGGWIQINVSSKQVVNQTTSVLNR